MANNDSDDANDEARLTWNIGEAVGMRTEDLELVI